jgi:flagellar hook-associated protein 1 FlgK
LLGNSQQTGTLNQFATALAGTVNGILESGTVSTNAGAAAGTALFTTSSTPTDAAASLEVNPAITASQLAPVDSSGNANGNANQLAALTDTTVAQLGGMSLTQYFGQITSDIGQENQTATDNQTSQQQVVAQATTLINQVSGVSLNEEATNVLQFQSAYQASAQVLTVLNTIADSVIAMITPMT